MIWTVFEMDKEPDSVSDRHRKCSIAAGTILTAYIPLVLSINFLMFTLLCVSYWLLCFKKIRAGVLHCCTLFLCYDRNPNINNRDHLVGQLTSTGWNLNSLPHGSPRDAHCFWQRLPSKRKLWLFLWFCWERKKGEILKTKVGAACLLYIASSDSEVISFHWNGKLVQRLSKYITNSMT